VVAGTGGVGATFAEGALVGEGSLGTPGSAWAEVSGATIKEKAVPRRIVAWRCRLFIGNRIKLKAFLRF
jgi:hypothetical protein